MASSHCCITSWKCTPNVFNLNQHIYDTPDIVQVTCVPSSNMLYMMNSCTVFFLFYFFFFLPVCSSKMDKAGLNWSTLTRSVAFAITGNDDADVWLIWDNIECRSMKCDPNIGELSRFEFANVYEREQTPKPRQLTLSYWNTIYTVFMFQF